MVKISGYIEAGAGLVGLVVGCIAGYSLGGDAVEYARQATQNADMVSALIKEHPTLTYSATMLGTGSLCSYIGRLPGALLDQLFGTTFDNY